jgi:hypothetical protein
LHIRHRLRRVVAFLSKGWSSRSSASTVATTSPCPCPRRFVVASVRPPATLRACMSSTRAALARHCVVPQTVADPQPRREKRATPRCSRIDQ